MEEPRLYRKGNSFRSLSGDSSLAEVIERVAQVEDTVSFLDLTHRDHQILARALSDLRESRDDSKPSMFYLRPHVVEEIARIPDEDLARYLIHRYRYDVFPVTKELDAFPPCVQIEPTSICNYRCVFCFQTDSLLTKKDEGHMGQMSVDTFKSVIDQIEDQVEFVTLASRGEPLLTKGIEEMLAYASGKFLGLKMNTNASFLTEEKAHAILQSDLNTLVFSIDAADSATYSELRVNGKFERVMSNILRFMEIKNSHYSSSRLMTRVSGVAYDKERQDHSAIEGYWRELVEQVAFVDYNPWENAYDNSPNGVIEPCSDLWRRCFVWWDGRMNPCDVDYRSFLSPGSVGQSSVSEIWRSEAYEHLRAQHLSKRRQELTPCAGCVAV